MFYLTTHSTHFIYGYMASHIWLRTIQIVRKKTRCRHIGYCYRLTARVLLYAPSHRQDNTYHGLCYTSRGALAGTKNSSMGPPNEGSIRRPTAPWANALPLSYVPLLYPNTTRLYCFFTEGTYITCLCAPPPPHTHTFWHLPTPLGLIGSMSRGSLRRRFRVAETQVAHVLTLVIMSTTKKGFIFQTICKVPENFKRCEFLVNPTLYT